MPPTRSVTRIVTRSVTRSVTRNNGNKRLLLQISINPNGETHRVLRTSFQEYLLHEEDLKRHVNLVVRRRILRDNTNPFELSEEDFRRLYRFDRTSVQKLIIDASRRIETPQVPIMIRIFAALHFFAHGTYQVDFDGVFQKKQFENVLMVADGLQKLTALWIKFPGIDDYDPIKKVFLEETSFPGAIGSIDCHQIRIKRPKDKKIRLQYLNIDGYYSMNVQLICDNTLKIIESVSGNPGGTTSINIWEKSRTNAILQHRYRADKKGDSWLLGDSHYKLSPWVLVPTRPAETEEDQIFNNKHAMARACSRNLIQSLKSNFRCLAEIDATPVQAQKIIDACLVLHNMLRDRGLIEIQEIKEELMEDDEPVIDLIPHKGVHYWQIHEGAWVRDRAKAQIMAVIDADKEAKKDLIS